MNAGVLNVIATTLTVIVIPSITLLIKLYLVGADKEDKPCCADKDLSSSHVSISTLTSSKLYNEENINNNGIFLV